MAGRWNFNLPVYALFITLLFILIKGYQFNIGDQAEHLPQIYQLQDPELYTGDYFVNDANEKFTVRFYFVESLNLLSKLFPLEGLCFILTILSIWLSVWSVMKITLEFSPGSKAVYLSPLLVFIIFYGFTIGGNHIQYSALLCSTIAKALSCLGILYFIRKQFLKCGTLLGIATLFQPLVGLQLFVVFFIIQLLDRTSFKSIGKLSLSFGFISGFILVPILYRQFFIDFEFDSKYYNYILFEFRNYHHYLPSLFPERHYIKFIGVLVTGLLALRFSRINHFKLLKHFFIVVLSGLLIYSVALELFNISTAGKTQWFKTTIWLAAFSSIGIAIYVTDKIQNLIPLNWVPKVVTYVSAVGIPILLFVILNSESVPVEKIQGKYMVGNYKKSDLQLMHEWIEANTPKSAKFLVEPLNDSFSCQAKRPLAISFRAIIHEPFFLIPCHERFKTIYSIGTFDTVDWSNAAAEAQSNYQIINPKHTIGVDLGIQYRLDNISTSEYQDELGEIIHREGNYILTAY